MFFRNIILNEGLFDQVRVDHGKEFVLTLYMQEILAHHRTKTLTEIPTARLSQKR